MSKRKARLVAGIMVAMLLLILADLAAVVEGSLTWILVAFAVPGFFKLCRTLWKWLQLEDLAPFPFKIPTIRLPRMPWQRRRKRISGTRESA